MGAQGFVNKCKYSWILLLRLQPLLYGKGKTITQLFLKVRSYNHREVFFKNQHSFKCLHLHSAPPFRSCLHFFPPAKNGKITKLDQYRIKVAYIQINLRLIIHRMSNLSVETTKTRKTTYVTGIKYCSNRFLCALRQNTAQSRLLYFLSSSCCRRE